MDQRRAYELLGLEKEIVTKGKLKHAYRERCKMLHPDDNPSDAALQLYLLVQEAYHFVLEHQFYQQEKVTPYSFENMEPVHTTTGGKIVGNWKVTTPQYSNRQYREKMLRKLEEEQRKKRKENEERKRKLLEETRKTRKLPSEREAEKWKKIEAEREAERIAKLIQQIMKLDLESDTRFKM